jgi:hypothetical protein
VREVGFMEHVGDGREGRGEKERKNFLLAKSFMAGFRET